MPEKILPVDVPHGDARHRDVRDLVFAAVPQQQAPWSKRIFWRVVLFAARFATARRLLKKLR